MAPILIAVEGSIGAGKSTALDFLHHLLTPSRCLIFKEPLCVWTNLTTRKNPTIGPNLLAEFYRSPAENCFLFQSTLPLVFVREFTKLYQVFVYVFYLFYRFSFLLLFSVLQLALANNVPYILTERSIVAGLRAFIPPSIEAGFLTSTQQTVLNYEYETLAILCPLAFAYDHVVYLETTPKVCLERIKSRGRVEECEVIYDF